jgi:hypothetical protein
METYRTKNNIEMVSCEPLNWQIIRPTFDADPYGPLYVIYIGSLSDMWQASFSFENMTVSFTSMHYSDHEVYRFKVDSIEEASELVLKFAKGMNRVEDLKETIYWN